MNHKHILIYNAHMNNLKNIDLEIPKHKVVAFTGVSGSGKSSLVFDTIYTEAQRQLVETFSTFARTRMPKLSRPDVEDIKYLSTAIVIDQKRMGNNLRSTVGTATEINTYLRLVFSRIGVPFIGPSFFLSFNHPEGMCPYCHGLGKKAKIDIGLFLDLNKSLQEGAINHPFYKSGSFMWKELLMTDLFDNNKALKDYTQNELDLLLYSESIPLIKAKEKFSYSKNFEGIARKLEKSMTDKAEDERMEEDKNAYTKFFSYGECPKCKGSRLNENALSVKINNINIAQLCQMELPEVLEFVNNINNEMAIPVIRKVQYLLSQLIEIGVGYLSLDRAVSTLSGGEAQRVKMAKQLDCNLVDLIYILDEPSIGLHPRDTEKLIKMLFHLKEKGNSVLVVEHDPDIIKASDWIIDMGPQAGKQGGQVVYSGEPNGLMSFNSITGHFLFKKEKPIFKRKKPKDFFLVENASIHNLKDVTVRIPKGVLTCITGVAGSGKSSLIHQCFLKKYPEAIVINQSAIGKSSRATLATYIGVFDLIRKEFSSVNNVEASLFSFNSKGACQKCNGQGTLSFEMHFLDAVKTLCDECEGKRYHSEVLNYKLNHLNISEVLTLTVIQAIRFFHQPKIVKLLKMLETVGLGYLMLGQTLSTLSGGEAQRLKIASELHKKSQVYVMDEPTTGLHMSDIDNFYQIINTLVADHNTVIIIEHNLDIIKYADWIIDMGPEGGEKGGFVLFEGIPEDLINLNDSHTGRFLKKVLEE